MGAALGLFGLMLGSSLAAYAAFQGYGLWLIFAAYVTGGTVGTLAAALCLYMVPDSQNADSSSR